MATAASLAEQRKQGREDRSGATLLDGIWCGPWTRRREAWSASRVPALDLVDGAPGVLDVGHEGRRHAARVARYGDGVGSDAGGGERGEDRGVGEPGRRGEPQPRGDRQEHRGVVDIADRGEHGEYRHRDVPRAPHPSRRLVLLFRPDGAADHSGEKESRRRRPGEELVRLARR